MILKQVAVKVYINLEYSGESKMLKKKKSSVFISKTFELAESTTDYTLWMQNRYWTVKSGNCSAEMWNNNNKNNNNKQRPFSPQTNDI